MLDKNLFNYSISCPSRSFFYNTQANSNGMCSANLTVDMAIIDLSEKHRNVESSNVHCMTLCRDNTCFAATEKTESRYKIRGRKTSQVGRVQRSRSLHDVITQELWIQYDKISCLKWKLCGNCHQLLLAPHWTLLYLAIPVSSLTRISDPCKVLSRMPRIFDLRYSISLGSYL